jgi:hypothetical protein
MCQAFLPWAIAFLTKRTAMMKLQKNDTVLFRFLLSLLPCQGDFAQIPGLATAYDQLSMGDVERPATHRSGSR